MLGTGVGPGPSTASDSSPPSHVIAHRYTILGLLGMGGMGRVYRAHDRTLDEVVALKILRSDRSLGVASIEAFRQEVKLARRVTSPHVVRTFDVGEHGDDHFLTMEYLEGRSLARLIDDGPLGALDVLRIARAAAAGIAAAHAAAVLHRDLKSDNILVAADGRIAITDFGIARLAHASAASEEIVGTPAYMAPEQLQSATIGPPADVYAFGAILFEMLVGRRPFAGTDLLQLAVARLTSPPPDPRAHARAVPDALAEFVVRCLAVDPEQRFADGADLVRALAALELRAITSPIHEPGPLVPHRTSRSIAVLPLRAPAELAELAEGLAEEIVDTLSMTRELRVRPLVSARAAHRPDEDPAITGRALGVEVVVDGSLRRIGDTLRLSARAIGVADGFQLWASRIDSRPESLLAAADEVARLVARALTVELDVPLRRDVDPRAAALYLEAKGKLRTSWMIGRLEQPVALLEEALRLAPDDGGITAALSTALSRLGFMGTRTMLPRARLLAERAVALAPADGEAWYALAIAHLYAGDVAEAAHALVRAVGLTPGVAIVQAMLGAVLLEVGAFDDALAHLEAARALDPGHSLGTSDLARAYLYAGRDVECFALLREDADPTSFTGVTIGRFKAWRGERYEGNPHAIAADLPNDFAPYTRMLFAFYRTHELPPDRLADLLGTLETPSPRLRAARAQFAAEFLALVGDHARALDCIERSIAAGLQDHYWLQHCPLLAPMHELPRFRALAAIVETRAATVLARLRAALVDVAP
ncbi:MAG: protein kinase [Proteobacteria bacterium]|nr:protein kinase [Pseudomonadota bacterium]